MSPPPATDARYTLTTSDDLLLCTGCGAQYEEDEETGKTECRVCEVSYNLLLESEMWYVCFAHHTYLRHLPTYHALGYTIYLMLHEHPHPISPLTHTIQDPRQFIPPSGQTFTTLGRLKAEGKYENIFEPNSEDSKVIEIHTKPKVRTFGPRGLLPITPTPIPTPNHILMDSGSLTRHNPSI